MSDKKPGPVLITGANSGIGLASALLLARRGWSVYGTVRSAAKAEQLAEEAKKAKLAASVHPLVLDVSDHEAVVKRWPELPDFHAVVNNAGYSETGAVEEVSAARARKQLDVNLIAPAIVSACALPAMRKRGSGRIVMISSIAGRAAIMPLNAWYHASKFGLEALSDVLRVEVASFGVQVVIIEPGFFKTNIGDTTRDRAKEAKKHRGSPYAQAYQRMTAGLDFIERVAPDADAVARVVGTAVESARPRKRYLVGLDALATALSQPFTPREFTDLAMRLSSGLFGGRKAE
jgi:NAD(P)-dependent dehydrogenase (short-subunit alcohol dehydrogenase family)